MTRLSIIALALSFPLAAQTGLKIGGPAGTVELLSPERLPVAMNNYAEHRATAVLFLSTREESTDAAAESVRTLNQRLRHHGFLLVGVFPDPAQTPEEIRAF